MSDVHLGHRHNKTKTIIEHLDIFFHTYKDRLSNIQIFFIAGDLFDTLLDLSSNDIHEIMIWMSRLMRFCASRQIKLRILEGTPSHDWGQSSMFKTVDSIAEYAQLDYKYIPALSIETIEEYGMNILYVPDEWNSDTEETFSQVKLLMKEKNLTEVDIAIMHGQFTYQLPSSAIKAPKHKESNYLSIVRHYINIGHVHQFSTYERILAQGSFDRLCHADEEPKGALIMSIRPDRVDEYEFLPNKAATIFKTIRLTKKHFNELFQYLDAQIEKYPNRSFIRLRSTEKDLLNSNFDSIQKRYTQYTISKDIESVQNTEKSLFKTEIDMATYSPIVIRQENIAELLMQNIIAKHSVSNETQMLCRSIIEETIRG